MKLMHLSDLHLGKRVNEFSMVEDQTFILQQILQIIEDEQTDGVILAGDIYDRKEPSSDAVRLFDQFLVELNRRNQWVFLISGNHDSAQRIAFASRILKKHDIYISPVYDGNVLQITKEDAFGPVNFFLMPFVKPVHVSRFFQEEEINDYTDAIRVALQELPEKANERNVLILHQYVTGASRCESEETSIGGLDDVNASVLEGFDYVALGHLHGPQKVGAEHIRYSGTPLKYSFSEENHKKSVTIVELKEKGKLEIKQVPLKPLRDMKTLRGTYEDLTARSFYEDQDFVHWYLRIILTDEEDVPEALGRLRSIYPNIMKLEYDNERTRHNRSVSVTQAVEEKTPLELFTELHELQNGQPLHEEQLEFIKRQIEKTWGGQEI